MMNEPVKVYEVGPRDGLQNENNMVPAYIKQELIRRLGKTGLQIIEATSFVHPEWIPQLADANQVMTSLARQTNISYPVLVPNMAGLTRALSAGAKEIAIFTAASESFSQKNTNCSIAESINRFKPIMQQAKQENLWVRGYISTVLGCPYEGEVQPEAVVQVAESLLTMGCHEISLGDTIGVGTPRKAAHLIKAVKSVVPVEQIAVHFHDTYGQSLANILACLDEGVRVIDSSVAGLGGCPYARGASGNVASEDVVYMLEGLGMHTGIDLEKLSEIGGWITEQLQRPNRSRAGRAILANMPVKPALFS